MAKLKRKRPLRQLRGKKAKKKVKAKRKKAGKRPSAGRPGKKPVTQRKQAIVVKSRGGRTRRLTAAAVMVSLAFLLGCKTKPVKTPKPPKPPVTAQVPLPKLADFRDFLRFYREKLKTKSPQELAAEHPQEERKKVLEALTVLAKAKQPATRQAMTREVNTVLDQVKRFINEQTRLDRATMGLLAEQWVRKYSGKTTAELLEDRLILESKPKIEEEFEFDATAVTLEIIFRILQHRLKEAK